MAYRAYTICGAIIFLVMPAAAAAGELMVSAAASLKAPFEEIAVIFETRHPGMKVANNFAASGLLRSQIDNGAPADVFAAASPKEIDALAKKGKIIAGSRRDFAGNTLVLVTPAGGQGRISSFAGLREKGIGRIAIGNPATVPAGAYTAEVLTSLGLWDAVAGRLVFCAHVRQVADYVARGEVDAGIVFGTDAAARKTELRVAATAPASAHSPVVYTIAAIRGTAAVPAARDFISLVTAEDGKKVLARYGFSVRP